ncbi:MAG: alpha-L-fucosidase, partial [Tannerellaceae bacterium]
VEKFKLEACINNTWQPVSEGTTIGFKRILRFSPVKAKQLRFTITETRNTPYISEIGVYKASINEIEKSQE